MPAQQHHRHRRRRRNNSGRIVVIFAMAIAIPLIGWTAIALVSDDDESTPSSGTTLETSPPAATPRTESPAADDGAQTGTEHDETAGTDGQADDADPAAEDERSAAEAIDACSAQLTAGHAVVTEAKTGVGHWTEHIDARTDLLEGRNTEDETKAIWQRTRLAGSGDLERFGAVSSTYRQLAGCDGLAGIDPPQNLAADVEQCLVRAARTDAAVAAAHDAMADWEQHLNDMAEHADGHMTTDQAQDRWVEAWENGPINIDAFNEARDELGQAPACPGAGT